MCTVGVVLGNGSQVSGSALLKLTVHICIPTFLYLLSFLLKCYVLSAEGGRKKAASSFLHAAGRRQMHYLSAFPVSLVIHIFHAQSREKQYGLKGTEVTTYFTASHSHEKSKRSWNAPSKVQLGWRRGDDCSRIGQLRSRLPSAHTKKRLWRLVWEQDNSTLNGKMSIWWCTRRVWEVWFF